MTVESVPGEFAGPAAVPPRGPLAFPEDHTALTPTGPHPLGNVSPGLSLRGDGYLIVAEPLLELFAEHVLAGDARAGHSRPRPPPGPRPTGPGPAPDGSSSRPAGAARERDELRAELDRQRAGAEQERDELRAVFQARAAAIEEARADRVPGRKRRRRPRRRPAARKISRCDHLAEHARGE